MLVHKGGKFKDWGGECRDVPPTKSLSQNIREDVNREVKFFVKIKKKKKIVGGGGGGGWVGFGSFGGGQGGCERRIEVFVKKIRGGGGGGREGSGWGGVRVDVNEELKFL